MLRMSLPLLLVSLFFNACKIEKEMLNKSDASTIKTAYFGEKPPGLVPQLFAPEMVSPEGLFEGGKFSMDMKEFYFSIKNGKYKKSLRSF